MDPRLKSIFEEATTRATTPGGVVAVIKKGQVLQTTPFGHCGREPPFQVSVTPSTIYDIASLTKPLCTVNLCMLAVDQKLLDLDKTLGFYFEEAKKSPFKNVPIQHLLGHTSGFPAHLKFYESFWDKHGRDATMADEILMPLLFGSHPSYQAGQKSEYSDLGFIVLGKLLERVYQDSLDRLFEIHVVQKLGLKRTAFRRLSTSTNANNDIAPTEKHPNRVRLHGAVHDENCYVLDGVAGHAGLFSDMADMLTMLLAWIHSFHGSDEFIKTETLNHFWTHSIAPKTSWRLGFDTPSEQKGVSHAGDLFPRDSVGHLGYTGTSFWIDPKNENAILILSNRVYDSRKPQRIKLLRRQVMDNLSAKYFCIKLPAV